MDDLLERAIRLAAKVHKGQVDRLGRPYILHVMRVCMRGHDHEERILGALHDVLERSDMTIDEIARKGFAPRIVNALDHITKREGETYEAYIERVMQDPLASRVKLHDLADKMDLQQVRELTPADLKRYNRQLAAYHRLRQLVEELRANMTVKAARVRRGG